MNYVIKQIAEIQVEALNSIIANPSEVNFLDLRDYLEVDDADIVSAATRLKDVYLHISEAEDSSRLIALLNEYQLGSCIHILFNIEDNLISEYPIEVNRAWSILMDAQKKFHPELSIIEDGKYTKNTGRGH